MSGSASRKTRSDSSARFMTLTLTAYSHGHRACDAPDQPSLLPLLLRRCRLCREDRELRRRRPGRGPPARRNGHVAHRGALGMSRFLAQIVERGAAVHGAAVVPDDEIVHTPAVGIDELPRVAWRGSSISARPSASGMPRMRPACDAR